MIQLHAICKCGEKNARTLDVISILFNSVIPTHTFTWKKVDEAISAKFEEIEIDITWFTVPIVFVEDSRARTCKHTTNMLHTIHDKWYA